jgi:hypothetical protein
VYGPQRGYTSEASASFKLNPSSAFQTSGKVGFGYDGLNRTFGFTLQNLDMVVATESAKVALSGVNNTPGEFKFDALKVEVPSAGASMVMSGYQVKNGKADWKSLSIMNTPNMALQIGNVVSVSEMQASVAGASAGYATMASANLKVDAGQSAKVNGKLYVINDPANRQSGVALSKGNMAFQVPGWNLQVDGINSIQGGVKVDTVSLAAEPLSLTAEVTGVVVSDTTGFAFDQAKVAYAPTAGGANGFAMTVTRSDAGYVLTTTTVFPVAARK